VGADPAAACAEDATAVVSHGTAAADIEVIVLPVTDGANGKRPQPPVKDTELVVVDLRHYPGSGQPVRSLEELWLIVDWIDPDLAIVWPR
jgi:hypothetical protein